MAGRVPLARQVLILQLAVLAVVIVAAESTRDALLGPDPTAILQPKTERIRQSTGMDFIVVMAPDRTRYTHTNSELIGQHFTGNIDRALGGETFTEIYTGSLGPSIRSVTPVRRHHGGGTGVGGRDA